ncbi:MAG: rRNA pseudouridine synthase [Alistipes sp.]|nr:rRNA pseudouridine synthase [Candidatus Minthomonas equi]
MRPRVKRGPAARSKGTAGNENRRFEGERSNFNRHSEDTNARPRRSFRGGNAEDNSRPRRSFRDRKPFEGRERGRRVNPDGDYAVAPKVKVRKPQGSKSVTKQPSSPDTIRLNRFIANSGVCSRREADEYISAGVVTVNGEVVTELGVKVHRDDDVRFNGERLKGEKKVYIIMNKPKDFVTTTSDPHAEKSVMDLISKEMCPERVFPVGRLDKSTTGVLLFTNDGALTETLTHPSYERKKIYQVVLDKNLKKSDFEKILSGIELEDGFIAADALSYLEEKEDHLGIEIHSGRNRIVRRIFESFGYSVKRLDRVYFAGLTKKDLRRGQWRFLTEREIGILKMGSYE